MLLGFAVTKDDHEIVYTHKVEFVHTCPKMPNNTAICMQKDGWVCIIVDKVVSKIKYGCPYCGEKL